MKESEIKKKFDAASAAFAARLDESYAKIFLTALRDAVKELQESGMNISLDVRLRKNGSAVQRSEIPVANATTIAEGDTLEWIILGGYNKSNLIAHDGSGAVIDFEAERRSWSGPWNAPATPGAVSLKDAIMNAVIDHAAQARMIAEFGVPSSGITGTLDKKPLAAPKLGSAAP